MPNTLPEKETQSKKYIDIRLTEPSKTSDEMDNEFLSSLAQQSGEQPIMKSSLTQDEMNTKRKELLDAGFNNKEIDEYYGVESPPDWQQKFSQALTATFNYPVALAETAGTMVSGSAAWLLGKTAGSIVGLSYGTASGNIEEGVKYGKKTEEKIAELLTLAPKNPQAKELIQTISYVLDNTVTPIGKETGDMMANTFRHSQLAPWIRYITEFGTELFLYKLIHKGGKKIGTIAGEGITKIEKKLTPKEKADIITEYILKDKTPEEVIAENKVKKYTSAYPDAKPKEFFSKTAEESFRAFEDTARVDAFRKAGEERHAAMLEQLRNSTKETGKNVEESAQIFDSTESKLQEIDVMIDEINTVGNEIGYGNLKPKLSLIAKDIPEFDSKILKTLPPDEATASLISHEINKLNDLRSVAERATGMDLKSFYDKAIDEALKILPKGIEKKITEQLIEKTSERNIRESIEFKPAKEKLAEIQELASDIQRSQEPKPKAKGKLQIVSEQGADKSGLIDTKKQIQSVISKIDELTHLREIAEKATGQNLRSIYDKAIDDVINQLPDTMKIEIKSAIGESKRSVAQEIQGREAITPNELVNAITLSKMGDRIIKGENITKDLQDGIQLHGKKALEDALTKEEFEHASKVSKAERKVIAEKFKTVREQLRNMPDRPEGKVKPTQPDMLGVVEGTMEGKIPSIELPETLLEKGAREAGTRKIETEMAKKQLGIPVEEGKMSLEERASLLERAGQKEAAKKLRASQPLNIITWIKSKGGIDYLKEEWGGEIDIAIENQPSLKGAVNKKGGGLTLDELSMMAKAEGRIKEASKQELLDAINGKKISTELANKRERTRLIAEEAYGKAKARLDEMKNKLYSGMDVTAVKDAVIVGAYHLESGIRDFTRWSELMVKQHGEDIKPYLDEIWGKSQQHLKEGLITQTKIRLETQSEEAKTKPRQFLKTVEESSKTTDGLKGKVEEIKPEEYTIQPNTESLSMAEKRINAIGTDKAIEELKNMKVDLTSPWGGEVGARIIGLAKKLEAEKNFDKAVEVIEEGDRIFREAGRLVQSASLWNKLSPEGFLRWADKQIGKINEHKGILDSIFGNKKIELTKEEKARIIEEKTKINAMSEGIEKTNAAITLMDSIAAKVPPTISELIDAYRYQNMLSGWQTQERNIGNNILNTIITRPAVLTTKGMVDYIEASLFGKERQAYVKDVPVYLKHAFNAIPNAIEAFKAVWNGTDTTMLKPDLGVQTKTAFEQARFRQMPKYLTVIQRLMEASDKFNVALIAAGEYAVRLKNGTTPERAFVAASEIAKQYLYRNKYKLNDPELSAFSKVLGDLGYMLESNRNLPVLGPPMKWAIPFIRTPINVGILATELSPLGLLRTKGFTPEVKARIAAGSVITAMGAIFAMNDKTTWVAPSDPKSKKMFYATGRKPFSVEINGKYIPLWYLGPFSLAFALPVAIKYYTEDQKKALSKDSLEKLIDIAAGTARFIGSQSSTQSIGAFFNILAGDVDYTFPGQLGFTASQMIPLSGLLRNTNKILDPVYRDPEGYWEPIKKDLPFLSNDIPAHTTPMGEESKREWWNALLPYEIGKEDEFYDIFYKDMIKAGQIRSLENDMEKKMERGTFNEKALEDFLDKLSDSYNE